MTPQALSVLMVEDDPSDAELVLRALRGTPFAVQSTRVDNEEAFRRALSTKPDVILCDYEMPGFGGFVALRILREQDATTPFLLISGTIGEETAVEAMKLGATDYLLKDRLGRLESAIAGALERRLFDEARERHATALRDAQAARDAEQRFRALLEAAPDAMVVVDAAGSIALVNAQTERLFGYAREELVGKPVEMLMPIGARTQHAAHRAGYLADQRVRQMGSGLDLSARRKDGAEFPVEISLSPLQTERGVLVFAAVRDVTERKLAKRALLEAKAELERRVEERTAELRASEARFAGIVESGLIGVAFVDVHGLLLDANDAYLQMTGYTREDVTLGKVAWASLTPQEWRHTDELAIGELVTHGAANPWEKEIVRKDGTRMPALLGVALSDFPKCNVFMVDLTAQKRTEKALRDTEERLRHAQKMEAVGRLAGGVAHDFNNLLSVVLSYASILLEELGPEDPVRADIEAIHKAGQRAADLTRQLLAFSRQQVLEPKVLDLQHLLSSMKQMLERLLGADVDLRLDYDDKLGCIRADHGQIEQVVMNLVVNARHAMPHGGRLAIRATNLELPRETSEHPSIPAGSYVTLEVDDSGVGMTEQVRSRIFEPFFTTKERGKGTGLGLSTVLGIVVQSGAHIRVESSPDAGTSFIVYFPRSTSAAEEASPQRSSDTIPGRETVLVVEDDPQVRDVTASILERSGYRVVATASGKEAIELCEAGSRFDLLLTDLVLPQMSGRRVAEAIRERRPSCPVLFMSGYTDDTVLQDGMLSGAKFLPKPITPETLTRKVRETLDARRPAEQAEKRA